MTLVVNWYSVYFKFSVLIEGFVSYSFHKKGTCRQRKTLLSARSIPAWLAGPCSMHILISTTVIFSIATSTVTRFPADWHSAAQSLHPPQFIWCVLLLRMIWWESPTSASGKWGSCAQREDSRGACWECSRLRRE